MNAVLWGIAGYVFVQLVVGVIVSRRVRTESDYLLAGRRLGPWTLTFSIFATWFGAEACIGSAAKVYDEGLPGASVDPFGYALCLILAGLFFAVPLWRRGLTTLADLFAQRYSHGVERIAVLMMVPTSVGWAAAQIRAFGQVLATASPDIDVVTGMTVATAVVIAYTAFGGLRADAVTDLVQGIAIVLGLGVLLVLFVDAQGGIAATWRAIPSDRLVLFDTSHGSLWRTLETWAIPTLGSVVAPEIVARFLGARDPHLARRSAIYGGALYLAVGLVPVTLALAAITTLPGLADGEQLLPSLARQYLGPVLYVLFAGALISAILSTVDSALLSAGALTSHNLVQPLVPGLSEAAKVRIARIGVVGFGITAWMLALRSESIYELVAQAAAFGGAGIFVIVVFGLFTRFGGAIAAHGALAVGAISWCWGAWFAGIEAPYLASAGASALAYVAIAAFGSGRRDRPEEVG